MTLNMMKCQFSVAYLQAVAAVAGLKVSKSDVDDDSVDIGLERSGGCAPKLDIQLKCTAVLPPADAQYRYDLKIKNYNDLRRPTAAPRWLVVLFVPELPAEWMAINQNEAILRHHARWLSLADEPETENEETIGVFLPHNNIFTTVAVIGRLNEIENGFEAQ